MSGTPIATTVHVRELFTRLSHEYEQERHRKAAQILRENRQALERSQQALERGQRALGSRVRLSQGSPTAHWQQAPPPSSQNPERKAKTVSNLDPVNDTRTSTPAWVLDAPLSLAPYVGWSHTRQNVPPLAGGRQLFYTGELRERVGGGSLVCACWHAGGGGGAGVILFLGGGGR